MGEILQVFIMLRSGESGVPHRSTMSVLCAVQQLPYYSLHGLSFSRVS